MNKNSIKHFLIFCLIIILALTIDLYIQLTFVSFFSIRINQQIEYLERKIEQKQRKNSEKLFKSIKRSKVIDIAAHKNNQSLQAISHSLIAWPQCYE